MLAARRTLWLGLVMIGCGSTNVVLAQSEEPTTLDIARVLEVCDLVADRHVDPPAKQQLVLLAAKSIYEMKNESAPRGLSKRVSSLNKTTEFESLLNDLATEANAIDTASVIESLLSRVPGGGRLVNAEEARVGARVTANQYVGVGIALSMQDDRPVITTSFYGGPGHKVGVKNDDKILKIDGNSTEGKSLGEVVKELRGEAGTEVTLQLAHPTLGEREIVVTRNVTFIPTIHGASQDPDGKWNYRLPDHPDVAMFRLDSFGASSGHELRKLASTLSDSPLKGIILDLRRGGGNLHHVVMVADQFLEEGVIGSTEIGDAEATYKSEEGSLFKDVPMVVLTSKFSSASSVFLAAALQDRGRAVVVGEPTNGVSYVRSQLDLTNGDKIIIPTGYVRRGNGTVLFEEQNPMLAARRAEEFRNAKDLDRKSASVVVPNHIVLGADGASTQDGEPARDRMTAKAVAVLKPEVASGRSVRQGNTKKVSWVKFTEAKLEELLDAKKPVLIQFSADWCMSCQVNERLALNTPETIMLIKQHDLVPLYADYTRRSPEISKYLDLFDSISVPLTVVVTDGDVENAVILRDAFTQATFTASIEKAFAKGR